MPTPISFQEFVNRARSTASGRKPLTLLHIMVKGHTAESRWENQGGHLVGLSDADIVSYLMALVNDIEARGLDAEGNDALKDSQMLSLRALMKRFMSIITDRGLDFEGRTHVTCRHVMARVHQVLPELEAELEEAERQRTPERLEVAS